MSLCHFSKWERSEHQNSKLMQFSMFFMKENKYLTIKVDLLFQKKYEWHFFVIFFWPITTIIEVKGIGRQQLISVERG